MKPKLFIVTLQCRGDGGGQNEFLHQGDSMISIIAVTETMRLRVCQIEEIPHDSSLAKGKDHLPWLKQLTVLEAEDYRIHGPEDANVFE